jgi:hypothetical protein
MNRRFFLFPVLFIIGFQNHVLSQALPPDLIISPKIISEDTIYQTNNRGLNPQVSSVAIRIGTQGQEMPDSVPVDVLLTMDRSGTMGNTGRMDPAKIAAKHFIDRLGPVDRAALASFGDPEWSLDYTFAQWDADQNKAPIKAEIDSLVPNGGKPLWWAAWNAAKYLAANGRTNSAISKVVIILADGGNNHGYNGARDYAATLDTLKKYHDQAGVRIFTILIATNKVPDMVDFSFMGGADSVETFPGSGVYRTDTSSQYFYSATGYGLDSIYQRIATMIKGKVASQVDTTTAFLQDVLPTGLGYVNGSWQYAAGNTVGADTFSTRTVGGGLTQLNWFITKFFLGDSIAIDYQLRGTAPGLFPVNVTSAQNATYYSRAEFNNFRGNYRNREFPAPPNIYVLNAPDSADLSIQAQGGNRQAAVTFNLAQLEFSAADHVYLFWSKTGYVTNTAAPDTILSYAQLAVPGQNTVIIPGLDTNTTYYFTAAFDNRYGIRSNINPARNGDTATTAKVLVDPPQFNGLRVDAVPLTDTSIIIYFSGNIWDDDIDTVGLWWSDTGYRTDTSRAPDAVRAPTGRRYFILGPVAGQVPALVINGLTPATRYYFTVNNQNSKGWGTFTVAPGQYLNNSDTATTWPAGPVTIASRAMGILATGADLNVVTVDVSILDTAQWYRPDSFLLCYSTTGYPAFNAASGCQTEYISAAHGWSLVNRRYQKTFTITSLAENTVYYFSGFYHARFNQTELGIHDQWSDTAATDTARTKWNPQPVRLIISLTPDPADSLTAFNRAFGLLDSTFSGNQNFYVNFLLEDGTFRAPLSEPITWDTIPGVEAGLTLSCSLVDIQTGRVTITAVRSADSILSGRVVARYGGSLADTVTINVQNTAFYNQMRIDTLPYRGTASVISVVNRVLEIPLVNADSRNPALATISPAFGRTSLTLYAVATDGGQIPLASAAARWTVAPEDTGVDYRLLFAPVLGDSLASIQVFLGLTGLRSDTVRLIATPAAGSAAPDTLTFIFRDTTDYDTLRSVFIRERGSGESSLLTKTVDDTFTLESRGAEFDASHPFAASDWGISGTWSYAGFGGAAPVSLGIVDSAFTLIPGRSFPVTAAGSGWLIFTHSGVDPADGQSKTFIDSIPLTLNPGAPRSVHITSRPNLRNGQAGQNPALVFDTTATVMDTIELVAVFLDNFGNFTDTVPASATVVWKLDATGNTYLTLSPLNRPYAYLNLRTPVDANHFAQCSLRVAGYPGLRDSLDAEFISLLKSPVVAVFFTAGTPPLDSVAAHLNAWRTAPELIVYTGDSTVVFSAWGVAADGSVFPVSVDWQAYSRRNFSAYPGLTASGNTFRLTGEYLWAARGEDSLSISFPSNLALTHTKTLWIKPGVPRLLVQPADSAFSADSTGRLYLYLASTAAGLAGQLYTDTVPGVIVTLVITNTDNGTTTTVLDTLTFINGRAVLDLNGITRAGAYTVVVTASGTVNDPAAAINTLPATVRFSVLPGAPARARIAQILDSTVAYPDSLELALLRGQDSLAVVFQLRIFDQFGNLVQSWGSVRADTGVPAAWFHNADSQETSRQHVYYLTQQTANQRVILSGRAFFTLPDTVLTDTVILIPRVPVNLFSITFYDTTGDGRVDRLAFRFNNAVAPQWDSLVFETRDPYGRPVWNSVQPGTPGAVEDLVWIMALKEDGLPYRTDFIPAVISLGGEKDSTLIGNPVRYLDSAAPAIAAFAYTPTFCGDNLNRDRLTVRFSEKVYVYAVDGTGLDSTLSAGQAGELFLARARNGDTLRNPINGTPALEAGNISAVEWQNPADRLVIHLQNRDVMERHGLVTNESSLAFQNSVRYYLADSAGVRPPDAHRTILRPDSSGPAPALFCEVKQNNVGSAAQAAGQVTLDNQGNILDIAQDHSALAEVVVPGLQLRYLLAPLDPSGTVAINYNLAAQGDSASLAQLREALLQQKLGIMADVVIYDLIGNVTWHRTFPLYPTDFVEGGSISQKVDRLFQENFFQREEITYSWDQLAPDAKGKLLAWHYRNDKGRPVAKGAFFLGAFFRNSLITQERAGGRVLVFGGPIIHR